MKARLIGKFKTKEEACLAARLVHPDPVTVVRRGNRYFVVVTEEQEEEARLFAGWEDVDPEEATRCKCSRREYALAKNVLTDLVRMLLLEKKTPLEASEVTGVTVDRIHRIMDKYRKGYIRHLVNADRR